MEEKIKLYRCSNNSVVAIVSEEMMGRIEACLQIKGKTNHPQWFILYPRRIHTFSNQTHLKGWVNGTLNLLNWLVEQSGAEVVNAGFYVPFSNGFELCYRTEPEHAEEEWRFRTSADQLLADFGLM